MQNPPRGRVGGKLVIGDGCGLAIHGAFRFDQSFNGFKFLAYLPT